MMRHTGQTLAASAGATTKDLMLRLGHAPRPVPIATCTPWMAAMPRSRRPCPILLLMAMRPGSLNPLSSSTEEWRRLPEADMTPVLVGNGVSDDVLEINSASGTCEAASSAAGNDRVLAASANL